MDLKQFDTRNYLTKQRKCNNIVRLTARRCEITISSDASKNIGLKPGDRIAVFQDQRMTRDFYIQKTDDEFGFLLQKKSKNKKNDALICYAGGLIKHILKELKIQTSATFKIAVEPVKDNELDLFAIITSHPFNVK